MGGVDDSGWGTVHRVVIADRPAWRIVRGRQRWSEATATTAATATRRGQRSCTLRMAHRYWYPTKVLPTDRMLQYVRLPWSTNPPALKCTISTVGISPGTTAGVTEMFWPLVPANIVDSSVASSAAAANPRIWVFTGATDPTTTVTAPTADRACSTARAVTLQLR